MWWNIITFCILLTLAYFIVQDTHIKVYGKDNSGIFLLDEYDLRLTVLEWIFLVVILFLPVFNIITFAITLIACADNARQGIKDAEKPAYIASLKGNNIVTKHILKISRKLFREKKK